MSKQVYISADYDEEGDRDVVNELVKWGNDSKHKVEFIDMSNPSTGSVSDEDDCRICDLKAEFNKQINASSAVVIIVGDKTGRRTAGSGCERMSKVWYKCDCTPYKHNVNGKKPCKAISVVSATEKSADVGNINDYSYLRHEFEQAKKRNKTIVVLYNSTRYEKSWLPSYMSEYENVAHPFWQYNDAYEKVGDYEYIKEALGF